VKRESDDSNSFDTVEIRFVPTRRRALPQKLTEKLIGGNL
jgi:hypothetical protein